MFLFAQDPTQPPAQLNGSDNIWYAIGTAVGVYFVNELFKYLRERRDKKEVRKSLDLATCVVGNKVEEVKSALASSSEARTAIAETQAKKLDEVTELTKKIVGTASNPDVDRKK